jgi:hypothetical protein
MDDSNARDLAIRRLKQKREFTTHLVAYLVVNAFLWALWALTSSDYSGTPWPIWVTLGWGIGLAMNAWAVYGSKGITEADIQREMDRNRGEVDPGDRS